MQTKIGDVDLAEILQIAGSVIERYLTLPDNALPDNPDKDKKGAYMVIANKEEKGLKLLVELGQCSKDKVEKYSFLAKEKVERLMEKTKDITSYLSRNPTAPFSPFGKWGGGIRVPDKSQGSKEGRHLIGAISGFKEEGDEAVITVIFLACGWILIDDVKTISEISGNKIVWTLINHCEDLLGHKTN